MFISDQIITTAFRNITPIESDDGKTARERTSGIRYFLATAEILKQNNSEQIDVSPNNNDNRKAFIDAVGRVVKLNENSYTKNFHNEIDKADDYRVRNNFLTTLRNKPYPRRPAPLIMIQNDAVLSLHEDFGTNLLRYGKWEDYKTSLAVWLLRFDDFPRNTASKHKKLVASIQTKLSNRYGEKVAQVLIDNAKLEAFISSFVAPLCQDSKPDYAQVSPQPISEYGENIIVYGAPGTGKSYSLKMLQPQIRTVFHPDYQNSDFIGSYRPYVADGEITYKFVPGPFIKVFINAMLSPDKQHYLIIEEINRANASAVFGEVFQLLDRNTEGESEYQIIVDDSVNDFLKESLSDKWQGSLFIPANLSIYATMNSADQGVSYMDTAFKRRWTFRYFPIDFNEIDDDDIRNQKLIDYNGSKYSWRTIATSINDILTQEGIQEDRLLGQYFLSNNDFNDSGSIGNIVSGKLFIYLWDDILRHGMRHLIFNPSYTSFSALINAYKSGKDIFSDTLSKALQLTNDSE